MPDSPRNAYKPISCGIYDELVLMAMRKQTVRITYRNATGTTTRENAIIEDIETYPEGEFLIFRGGEKVRLDHIESFDAQ